MQEYLTLCKFAIIISTSYSQGQEDVLKERIKLLTFTLTSILLIVSKVVADKKDAIVSVPASLSLLSDMLLLLAGSLLCKENHVNL